MIRLSGLLRREAFRQILDRWLMGRFDPADGLELKRIVNFNAYSARIFLSELADELLGSLLDEPVHSRLATRKGELKDFIVQNSPVRSARIDTMIAHYRRFPEDYYRETPFEGRIYAKGPAERPTYVMSTRVKRMRRIAEKGARRIVEHLLSEIRRRADELAAQRAAELGIPKERLVTPADKQIEEFAHAERRMIKAIRSGTFFEQRPDLVINDVLGMKVITDFVPMDRLRDWFRSHPRIDILEEEAHQGRYNAVNFLLRVRLDKRRMLARAPGPRVTDVLVSRGVGPRESIAAAWADFVESGEDDLVVEVIASSYEEMIESEIGRAMHENRIFDQRRLQDYRGHLAKNIEYLVEYAFAFALSPTRTLDDLPIRVWVKYMPDTFDDMMKRLWGITPAASIPCADDEDSGGPEGSELPLPG